MKKLIIEFIKQEFEKEEYILLTKEYINNRQYLDFICPRGHEHKIKWNAWQQGQRCKYCDKYNSPVLYEDVKYSFENEYYQLLSKEYINKSSYLDFICPNGHKHRIKWNDWQQGHRCGKCYKPKLIYEKLKELFWNEGYTLLSKKYKSALKYLKYICPNGHKHKITWGAWQSGRRCPYCSMKGFSKSEKEITKYIKNNYSGIIEENNKTLIKNPKTKYYLELDIWLPELRKAIEYNSKYWHNSKDVIWKDNYKKQWCKENGIDLLVIEHDNWIRNKDFNLINNFIGV